MQSGPGALKREISGILLIKIAIILLAGFTIFGSRHRLHVDAQRMTAQLFDHAAPGANAHQNEGPQK